MSVSTTSATPGPSGSAQTTGGSNPDDGIAAETFAIGFAIGGTLLLLAVILVLVLQTRRKWLKSLFKKPSIKRPLVPTKSPMNNGTLPLSQPQSPVTRPSRLSSFANVNWNCFHPGQLASPMSIEAPPTITPPSASAAGTGESARSSPIYSSADACYRLPLDAIHPSAVEASDPHTYADPDTALPGAVSPGDVEAGLAYGTVSITEARRMHSLSRKTRAASVYIDDGPYKTTDLARASSLVDITATPTHRPQEAGLYLVRTVSVGGWNRRAPTGTGPATTPGHKRSASTGVVSKPPPNNAVREHFRHLQVGPLKSSSLSNLLDSSSSRASLHTGSLPNRHTAHAKKHQPQPQPPVPTKTGHAPLPAIPPKPPRTKHVDPDYIFVGRAVDACDVNPSGKVSPHHRCLRPSLSVPSKLHKRASGMSQLSNLSHTGYRHAAVVVDSVPQPLVRLASSEQIRLPLIMLQPYEAHVAEPLVELDPSTGCMEFKTAFTQQQPRQAGKTDSGAEMDNIYAVLEKENGDEACEEEEEEDDTIVDYSFSTGRRSSSLPDLSQFSTVDWSASRVKDRWTNYRMSAVPEGSRSRDESCESSKPPSFEHSLQQRRARKLLEQKRSSAFDAGDVPRGTMEPDYWVLESQRSQESMCSA